MMKELYKMWQAVVEMGLKIVNIHIALGCSTNNLLALEKNLKYDFLMNQPLGKLSL